jgi:chemotaxis protein CheX
MRLALPDAAIIEYVRATTSAVCSTMLGMKIHAGEARIIRSQPFIADGILSLIGLAGRWTGTGSLACGSQLARDIGQRLVSAEMPVVNEDVLDAIGEVTNMVIGNFKTMAEKHVGPLGLSIPTVIYGQGVTARSMGGGDWIVQPFQFGADVLEVRVCLSPAGACPHHYHMPGMVAHSRHAVTRSP